MTHQIIVYLAMAGLSAICATIISVIAILHLRT